MLVARGYVEYSAPIIPYFPFVVPYGAMFLLHDFKLFSISIHLEAGSGCGTDLLLSRRSLRTQVCPICNLVPYTIHRSSAITTVAAHPVSTVSTALSW